MKLITDYFDSTLPFVKFSHEVIQDTHEPSFEIVAFNVESDSDISDLTTDEIKEALEEAWAGCTPIRDNPHLGYILRTPHCLYEASLSLDFTIAELEANMAWNSLVGAHTSTEIKGPKHPDHEALKTTTICKFEDSITLKVETVERTKILVIESINPHVDFKCKLRSILVGDELTGEFSDQIKSGSLLLAKVNGVLQFLDVETDAEQMLSLLIGSTISEADSETAIEPVFLGQQFLAERIDGSGEQGVLISMEHEPDGMWGVMLRKPILRAVISAKHNSEPKLEDIKVITGEDERLELFSAQMEQFIAYGLA